MSHNRPDKPVKSKTKKKSPFSALNSGIGAITGAGLIASSAWIIYSNLVIDHHFPLLPAMDADQQEYRTHAGIRLSYYFDQQVVGRPLVLIHSINAAASAYEMSPLFNQYRSSRPVYALDLPGYGFSDRPNRVYSAQFFVDAIIDFLQTQVKEPADVIALSLGSEFVAQAALAHPELFASLTLISPSGLSAASKRRGSQLAQARGGSHRLHSIFSQPLWGRPLFDLIATRRSIQFFLQKSFVGPVPTEMIDYAYATSHQPGAEHVPLYFISGKLFTPNIAKEVYAKVNIPTLVIYDRDGYTSFEALPEVIEANPHWRAVQIKPSFGLPQFEKLTEVVQELTIHFRG